MRSCCSSTESASEDEIAALQCRVVRCVLSRAPNELSEEVDDTAMSEEVDDTGAELAVCRPGAPRELSEQ
jgi:hypothetical protein